MTHPPSLLPAGLPRPPVQKLDCLGVLNNTYIFFTSDNGFKLGNHNIPQARRNGAAAQ
jgi:arylsulfatase A-like enzyme